MKRATREALAGFRKIGKAVGWHEGITDEKMRTIFPVLKYHYHTGGAYYWSEADSYIFPLVHGVYCVSKSYFQKWNVTTKAT